VVGNEPAKDPRYLSRLDTADRPEPSAALATKTTRLKDKLAEPAAEMRRLDGLEARMLAAPDQQISRMTASPPP
jgi:transposase